MINQKIARPQDPYSPLWGAYWAENPMLKRGVGADGADDAPPADDEPEEDLDQIRRDAADSKRLREENERLTAKSREADKHKKEQERLAREASEKALRVSGDAEALNKSWEEKHSTAMAEKEEYAEQGWSLARSAVVDTAISEISSEMAVIKGNDSSAPIIKLFLRDRIGSKLQDGKLVNVVLDENGRETAMTLDDLKKEMRKTPYLKDHIIASGASGNGNPGGNGGGNGKLRTRAQVESMNPFDQSSYFKENGGKYAD